MKAPYRHGKTYCHRSGRQTSSLLFVLKWSSGWQYPSVFTCNNVETDKCRWNLVLYVWCIYPNSCLVIPHSQTVKYLGMTLALDSTCQEKTRRAWPKIQKSIASWEGNLPCRHITSWCTTNRYWSQCGPMAYSYGDAQHRATLLLYRDSKTKFSGTSLMHLGTSGMLTSTETSKWKWLLQKLEGSLGGMKRGFSITTRRSDPAARQ